MSRSDERTFLLGYLTERFGIPSRVFDHHIFFRRKRAWFLMQRSRQLASVSHLKISKAGLRSFQKVGAFIKPTTRFIQIFGHHATKGRYQLNHEQLRRLISGNEIEVDLGLDKGYVILTLGLNRILGLGFFINRCIRSQLPKGELKKEMII
ncbi:MAG: hypothetical protein U5R49_03350 [Deltaproteobacteria bacterium]|nr:hypothetical protein [Deltaproteobacteria bacterium]